jgi:hypothetical protein
MYSPTGPFSVTSEVVSPPGEFFWGTVSLYDIEELLWP